MMTIGQAAARSGVPPKTIRFYEGKGLIAPAERLNNHYRSYDDNDIRTLRFIQRARSLGFSHRRMWANSHRSTETASARART
jgi:MerR family copper efflux transcriptional regulator